MMIYVCTKKILTEICLRTLDLGTKTHISIIRKEGCEKINCRFRFVIMDRAQLKTIQILRKHIFRLLTPFPPTSIFSVLIKTYSKNIVVDTVVISYFTYYLLLITSKQNLPFFLTPLPPTNDYLIYKWSLEVLPASLGFFHKFLNFRL